MAARYIWQYGRNTRTGALAILLLACVESAKRKAPPELIEAAECFVARHCSSRSLALQYDAAAFSYALSHIAAA